MRRTFSPSQRIWQCFAAAGLAALCVTLLPVGAADAGNWPADAHAEGAKVARNPVVAGAPTTVGGGFRVEEPLPSAALAVTAATAARTAVPGDTYLLFADGFYAQNDTSSWMPYLMFGAPRQGQIGEPADWADRPAMTAARQLRLGIGLHRRLIDSWDMTVGYATRYVGPSPVDSDNYALDRHELGLRLRYRF